MKKKNRFNTIYEIGNNKYSIMEFCNDVYLGTTTYLDIRGRFRTKKINQGFKVLQLTAPITFLFGNVLNCNVVKEDKEFPDMTTYENINNKDLRNGIKILYDTVLDTEINDLLLDFNNWCNNLKETREDLTEEEINKIIEKNKIIVDNNIKKIKEMNKQTSPSFKEPKITDSVDLYNFSRLERVNFLYSQKYGSSLKISYFYDLDNFGVVTIYRVQTVRGYIKSIDTFVYDRKIIESINKYLNIK